MPATATAGRRAFAMIARPRRPREVKERVARLSVQAFVVGFVVLALLATSCTHGKSAAKPGSIPQGGDVVLAAEQEPNCMDWIAACATGDWGVYMVETNTMPRAYNYTDSGYQPSILLTGPADVQTTPQQVVTYHIDPKAVWNDGQPITSHDFEYTWDQIVNNKGIYDKSGYNQIESVNDVDPHIAVVTFSSPYPDWPMLFGGRYGILPSHLLEGKDRDSIMKDGYTFSGGPWVLDHWTKGSAIVLVPNDAYWGLRPNLSSVTFKFLTQPSEELQAYQSGSVLASYPEPESATAAFQRARGTLYTAVTGLDYEALWFNVQQSPLDSVAVRHALAYATDRNAIARRLLGPIGAAAQPIESMSTPAYGSAYSTPFAKYQLDLGMVNQLMTGAGWAKGSNGIWAKAGITASLQLKTTSGDPSRQLLAQMLQQEWQAAGFALTIVYESPAVLFGQDLPAGNFTVGLYTETAGDDDPGECSLWCSEDIPTQADDYTGQNWVRVNDPTLDKPWMDAETNLDDAARAADVRAGQAALADLVPALPLIALPDIVVINTDKLGVEGGTFQHNLAYGPFTYMNTWYAK